MWQQSITLPATILASGNNLYIGEYNKLAIHNLETGNQEKLIDLPKVGTVQQIYASAENLFITTGNRSWVIYDTNKGLAEISEPLLPYVPYIIEDDISYILDVGGFKAVDKNTQSVLWNNRIDDTISSQPVFTDDKIIIMTGVGKVHVLNRNTGDLLWSQDFAVISNLATDSSHLFFLTQSGFLKVMDLDNGQEVQSIAFSPGAFQTSTSNTMVGGYNIWVDAQDEIVVLSLGDSCQLMALQLKSR